MLKTAKALKGLGLALHWVRESSKAPVEGGWTSAPPKDWPSLKRAYRKGYNLGVRLGRVSKVGDLFLAVIDCDVKSEEPFHLKELEERLAIFFEAEGSPTVLSGRGNGSKHIYVLTKEPVRTKRVSQSKDMVKVYLPGVKPSKRDLKQLSKEEIKNGFRIRAAWEISLMGEGSQVVLPPSIHPDTKKEYKWLEPFSVEKLKLLELPETEHALETKTDYEVKDFTPVEVDLLDGRLPDEVVEKIVHGKGVEDRSKALLGVTSTMLLEGFSEDEVLSVLTDQDYALGEVAFDHARTSSRQVAGKWLAKYTLKKAKLGRDIEALFGSDIEPMRNEDGKIIEDEVKEKIKKGAWKKELSRNDNGVIKATATNVLLILRHHFGPDVIKHDAFSVTEFWSKDVPWASKGEEIKDVHAINFKFWLSFNYGFEPSVNSILEAFSDMASANKFHPVRDWINSLTWDGRPRVSTWLKDYLNATKQDDEYLGAVGTLMLVGMVARVFEPGCKFDWVPILEGTQGVGKSSTPRLLASDKWFSDAFLPIADKDAVMNIQGVWCYELGELTAMSKYETGLMKQFVARVADKIRPPYGSKLVSYPRQCIFVGTTDKDVYLKEDVGQRRYLPVSIGQCEFYHLEKDRGQLFAEAYQIYKSGYSIVEEGKRCEVLARPFVAWRVEQDLLCEQLLTLFNDDSLSLFKSWKEKGVALSELCTCPEVLYLGIKNDRSGQMRLAEAMKKIGFEKVGQTRKNDRRVIWKLKKKDEKD